MGFNTPAGRCGDRGRKVTYTANARSPPLELPPVGARVGTGGGEKLLLQTDDQVMPLFHSRTWLFCVELLLLYLTIPVTLKGGFYVTVTGTQRAGQPGS